MVSLGLANQIALAAIYGESISERHLVRGQGPRRRGGCRPPQQGAGGTTLPVYGDSKAPLSRGFFYANGKAAPPTTN